MINSFTSRVSKTLAALKINPFFAMESPQTECT